VIQLQSLAFGPFAEVEPLNPCFIPGHSKLRVTVDTDPNPHLPERQLLDDLQQTFPGLVRHSCGIQRAAGDAPAARGIVLLSDDPSANQAHLLEHLMLEYLSGLDHAPHLSGVTCAYASPAERSDIFIECKAADAGGVAATLAVDTLNAALADQSLDPLYPDALLGAAILFRVARGHRLTRADVARRAAIPVTRAAAVLDLLCRVGLVDPEEYAMNFSGEPHYRVVGLCERLIFRPRCHA